MYIITTNRGGKKQRNNLFGKIKYSKVEFILNLLWKLIFKK